MCTFSHDRVAARLEFNMLIISFKNLGGSCTGLNIFFDSGQEECGIMENKFFLKNRRCNKES